MKQVLFFLFFFIILISSSGAQEGFGPTILILSPNKTSADARLDYEINWSEKRKIRAAKERLKLERPFNKDMRHEAENIRIMYKKSKTLARYMNFYTGISYTLEQYLQYKLLERFPGLLAYAVKQKSSNAAGLKKVAKDNEMRFIINLAEVSSFIQEEDQKFTRIRFQVYDAAVDSMLLDKEYTGGQKNPGKDFDCQDNSLDCTINNAMIPFINDLFAALFPKKPAVPKAPNKASAK